VSKTSITIEFDPDRLSTCTDQRLALLWHVAQANPADGFEHSQPGDLAMRVGWEIIRRWLKQVPPEMYHHQQSHYARHQLGKFAIYRPGGPAWDHEAGDWNPAFHDGHYEPRMIPDTRELRDALAAKLADLGAFAGNLSREQIAQGLARIVLSQQDPGGAEPAHAVPMLQRLRDGQGQDAGAGTDE
jgi:hypothetical protein